MSREGGLLTAASPQTSPDGGAQTPRVSYGDAREQIARAEAGMGVTFLDTAILQVALTHPSYANEHTEDAPRRTSVSSFWAMPSSGSSSRRRSTLATPSKLRGA